MDRDDDADANVFYSNPDNTQDFLALAPGSPERLNYRGIVAHENDGRIRLLVAANRDNFLGSPMTRNYICKARFSKCAIRMPTFRPVNGICMNNVENSKQTHP